MPGDPTIDSYGSREARVETIADWLNTFANQSSLGFDRTTWMFISNEGGGNSTSISIAQLAINELRQPNDKNPLGKDEVVDVIEGIRQFIVSRSERG